MPDDVIARNDGGSFTPAPEGEFRAVCVDVIDLGNHPNKQSGSMQHKAALVFQIENINPDTNERFEIAQRFTVSMYDTAYLRKFLSQWRGKSYTEEEAEEGAPLRKLVGQNAFVTIEHAKVGDKIYANILSAVKLQPGMAKIEAKNYTRAPYWEKVKEKGGIKPKAALAAVGSGATGDPLKDEDDDLPF